MSITFYIEILTRKVELLIFSHHNFDHKDSNPLIQKVTSAISWIHNFNCAIFHFCPALWSCSRYTIRSNMRTMLTSALRQEEQRGFGLVYKLEGHTNTSVELPVFLCSRKEDNIFFLILPPFLFIHKPCILWWWVCYWIFQLYNSTNDNY